jgi:Zn-finger nucleic acid-binding protein
LVIALSATRNVAIAHPAGSSRSFSLQLLRQLVDKVGGPMADKWDERKKAQEDEYFVRKERELLAKLKAKQDTETKAAVEKDARMRCPKCGEPLKARSFQKIEIDQCTGCNGIWLDAGEMEQVAGKENDSWLGKFWQKNG